MRTPRHLAWAAALGLALTTLAFHAPNVAAATTPDAGVHVDSQAYEGPHHTILAGLRARCSPGFEYADLVVDFRQGQVTTPSVHGSAVPCDGSWHRQRVSSLEGFRPGRASVTARLSVTDATTGDPGRQGVHATLIYVRPAALVLLPDTATYRPHHVVQLVTRARCDAPWMLSGYDVQVTQGDGAGSASDSASSSTRPVCDGALHTVTFWFHSETGTAFHHGPLRVESFLTVLDPDSFDPVAQARAARTVAVS